jgi:hypothetical protein
MHQIFGDIPAFFYTGTRYPAGYRIWLAGYRILKMAGYPAKKKRYGNHINS